LRVFKLFPSVYYRYYVKTSSRVLTYYTKILPRLFKNITLLINALKQFVFNHNNVRCLMPRNITCFKNCFVANTGLS